MKLKSISELDPTNIAGVFFDIDDTFSSSGKITAEAYSAIWRLKDAGKFVVPITGRPAGWCDHIARMWPVTAVVGENGAFYFMMKDGRLVRRYTIDKAKMQKLKDRLMAACDEVFKEVPEAKFSSDQSYREFDASIDYTEDIPTLPRASVDQIVQILKRHGLTTKISSVHVNAWFGEYDKLTCAKIFAREELGIDLDKDNSMFVFAGDSQNDEPMFKFFDNSVGVANVKDFLDRIEHPPKFITNSKSGKGFVEVVTRVLD